MNKKLILLTFGLLIGCVITVLAQSTTKPTITVGSRVSKYPKVKWLKGEPIIKFDKDKIYLIECWATWCVPCIAAIPHLNSLHEKFKDKIVFIGQHVWDEENSQLKSIVEGRSKHKINYNIATDESKDGDFNRKLMRPANIDGIPSTFIIKGNKIVLISHPLEITEKTLQDIIGS